VDATPPAITLIPETAPRGLSTRQTGDSALGGRSRGGALEGGVNRDLLAAPTGGRLHQRLRGPPRRAAPPAPPPRCYCFEVDLATQAFTQTAGGRHPQAPSPLASTTLVDVLGNSGAATGGVFSVTRLKWKQDVSTGRRRRQPLWRFRDRHSHCWSNNNADNWCQQHSPASTHGVLPGKAVMPQAILLADGGRTASTSGRRNPACLPSAIQLHLSATLLATPFCTPTGVGAKPTYLGDMALLPWGQ